MVQKIITTCFYLLFFLTPLLWAKWNFELFEFNKMMFVYLITIIVSAFWIIKMVDEKRLILKSTPLDLPLILFLIANILSTIFSIDLHLSIFGYYSRLNGGLLSTFCYLILYFALVSNFEKKDVFNFLKATLISGVVVAIYAIPEHFGYSPSCLILTGQFNADCWVQDVTARVFSTLGQPNWLAVYLGMLIFPALYFVLTATKKSSQILYTIYSIFFYLAFTFTYSRGANLGFLAGLGVFLVLLFLPITRNSGNQANQLSRSLYSLLLPVLLIFLLINLLFGSSLTGDFMLIKNPVQVARPGISLSQNADTQLDRGGTETGKIRLIVWQGALDIFKAYPIFGSGVETFAYSYYQFRPVQHNLVSEWDFLYNKAHNEFLNYLANTGIVGFATYLFLIGSFAYWCFKYYLVSIKGPSFSAHNTHFIILIPSLLASYIYYLAANFFGFSVVGTALLFFLFPAFAFLATDSTKLPQLLTLNSQFLTLLNSRPFYPKFLKGVTFVIAFALIISLIRMYWADTYFATGNSASEAGNPGRAYNQLQAAIALNPLEPYYRSELAYAAAAASAALFEDDATTSARLKIEALDEMQKVLQESPKNTSFRRTNVRMLFMLSTVEEKYFDQTLKAIDEAIALAPTDAKLLYNKAIILGQVKRNEEAINTLRKTIALKPDYRDAYYTLGLFYWDEKQKDKAVEQMHQVLKLFPDDPDALEKLKSWESNSQ